MRILDNGALCLLLFLPACGSVTASGTGKDGGKDGGSRDAHGDRAGDGAPVTTDGDVDLGDPLAPTVSATSPSAAATEVVLDTKVSATFSAPMKASTLNTTTFTLKQGTVAVAGAVSTVGTTATFAPSTDLAPGSSFTATIPTGATDLAGNPLASNHVWSFTTAACAATPVALGAATTFAVLAGSTVANTGATSILGDVGVSPGTALTGFPPGTIVGFQHADDATATAAAAAVSAAYDDASSRGLCVIPIAGDLGGRKLLAGLYNSTSSLAITSDDLTLDAQGDADAVFIFQMATTLTTASQVKVNLTDGASAANVFWQVGSSATLGAMSTFVGTILAAQSVTVSSGATVDGRVLARTAAVVLNSSVITEPTP